MVTVGEPCPEDGEGKCYSRDQELYLEECPADEEVVEEVVDEEE